MFDIKTVDVAFSIWIPSNVFQHSWTSQVTSRIRHHGISNKQTKDRAKESTTLDAFQRSCADWIYNTTYMISICGLKADSILTWWLTVWCRATNFGTTCCWFGCRCLSSTRSSYFPAIITMTNGTTWFEWTYTFLSRAGCVVTVRIHGFSRL
jgi:hypothetical protein